MRGPALAVDFLGPGLDAYLATSVNYDFLGHFPPPLILSEILRTAKPELVFALGLCGSVFIHLSQCPYSF